MIRQAVLRPRCLHVVLTVLACLVAAACSPGYYPEQEADGDGIVEMEPLEINAGLSIDSERFEDDYLGLTIRVPGAVSRISEAPNGARVVELGNPGITDEGGPGHVICELDAGPGIASLAVGDRLTAEGEYSESLVDSGTLQITLSACQIVR